MKQILYTLGAFLLCQLGTVSSHAQSWQWAKQMGGNIGGSTAEDSREEVLSIQVDKKGNSYVLFRTYTDLINPDKVQLDGTDLGKKYGNNDMVLASFDCSGKLRWGKLFGGPGGDDPYDMKIDTLGGIYICGIFNRIAKDSVMIDDDTILRAPSVSPFMDYRRFVVMKYDTAGNYKWLRRPEPDTIAGVGRTSGCFSMAVSPNGKVALLTMLATTGAFASGAYIVPPSTSLPALHMLQYDASGNFIKGFPMAITGTSAITMKYLRIAWDWKSDVYYVGAIKYVGEPALTFGSTAQTGSNLVAKFGSTGSFIWQKQSSSTSISSAIALSPVLDPDGNVYLCMSERVGSSFNGFTAANSYSTTGGVASLIKMNSAGTFQWGMNVNAAIGSGGIGAAYAPNKKVAFYIAGPGEMSVGTSKIYGSGTSTGDIQLVVDAVSGSVLSFDTLRGNNLAEPNAFCADAHGNFYSAYSYDVNLKVGSTTLGKYGGYTDVAFVKWGETSCDPIPGSGIADASPATMMKVYPNPAQDRIFVENAPAGTRLRLFNLLGAEVYSGVVGNTLAASIPLTEGASGMYLLHSEHPDGTTQSFKIMKE